MTHNQDRRFPLFSFFLHTLSQCVASFYNTNNFGARDTTGSSLFLMTHLCKIETMGTFIISRSRAESHGAETLVTEERTVIIMYMKFSI